ncbi:MAG: TlpA disulfide reductase family protein [Terriglobales bacterium]|jgi:thiol-disulfide isomerase/thioredoxin
MKKIVTLVIAAVLALAVSSCRRTGNSANSSKQAPDFSLTDVSGHPLRLADYHGKVVILDFWATWCEPCKQEIPHLIELQNKYPQRLQVIGISMDDDGDPVRAFQQQYKMNYPVAVGSARLADQYGGVLGLPITFVIDSNGRIIARHIGAANFSDIEAEVQKLL